MLSEFLTYIKKNQRFLLANSSGIDSMVLTDLFLKNKIDFVIAYCNFQLRLPDADIEEKFLKDFAEKNSIEFYTKKFDTISYSKKNNISTQMAARDLRYEWFQKIQKELKIDHIVTAHHLNDSVETLYFNLVKGTGPKGLQGISFLNQSGIIRPLINISKDKILEYAKENHISWKEDSSNSDNKYHRNKIRNKVIPLFQEINPNFIETNKDNLLKFRSMNAALSQYFEDQLKTFANSPNELDLGKIRELKGGLFLLEKFLKLYGFNFENTKKIFEIGANSSEARIFYSENYQIEIKDDFGKINEKKLSQLEEKLEIHYEDSSLNLGSKKVKINIDAQFPSLPEIRKKEFTFLDADKLKFPLILRKWEAGDKFSPYGMNGTKLISDYLIDKKYLPTDKENVYVLLSESEIVAVLNERISEKAALHSKTKRVLKLSIY